MASTSQPFQAVHDPSARHPRAGMEEIVEECLSLTADALLASQAASKVEVSHAIAAAREIMASDRPADLIDQVARAQGFQEEQLPGVILTLAEAVASTLSPQPPLLPFIGKLIAPSSFYESFDQIHKLARLLMCPVIYAEDTDAIGTASINPIASQLIAEEILNAVDRRFGIRPFVSAVRMDYESWTFLCRKHFAL